MKKILFIILFFVSTQSFGQSNNDIFKIRLLNASNAFSVRDGAQAIFYNDTLWLFGGWHGDSIPTTNNQVWYSVDNGLSFIQGANGLFTRRHTFSVGLLNSKIWIWQGDDQYTSVQNDVYTYDSVNGWVLVTSDKGTNGNGRQRAWWTIHKGYMYSISGSTKTDVVRSSDGITWSVVATLPTAMQNIINGSCTSFNGNLYCVGGHFDIGGSPLTMNNKVWISADDGVTWSIVAQGTDFIDSYPNLVATSTHLWYLGGATASGVNTKKLMYSYNGIDWVKMPYNLYARHASGMCVKTGTGGEPDEVYIVQGNLWSDSWKIIKINK